MRAVMSEFYSIWAAFFARMVVIFIGANVVYFAELYVINSYYEELGTGRDAYGIIIIIVSMVAFFAVPIFRTNPTVTIWASLRNVSRADRVMVGLWVVISMSVLALDGYLFYNAPLLNNLLLQTTAIDSFLIIIPLSTIVCSDMDLRTILHVRIEYLRANGSQSAN